MNKVGDRIPVEVVGFYPAFYLYLTWNEGNSNEEQVYYR